MGIVHPDDLNEWWMALDIKDCFYCDESVETNVCAFWASTNATIIFHPACAVEFATRLIYDATRADPQEKFYVSKSPRR